MQIRTKMNRLWGTLLFVVLLHIFLNPFTYATNSLKFEDIDRFLTGDLALEARAPLAENAEFVASIPLPRGKEASPFASGQVDAVLFSRAMSESGVGLKSRYGAAEGLRLGANWDLGSVALGAGYASTHKYDTDQLGKYENFDFSIQVSGLEFMTSLQLLETMPMGLTDTPLKNKQNPDRSFLGTRIGMNYSMANLALLKAGVEFVDLDALLKEEAGYQTSAGLGFDARLPMMPNTQFSAGYFFSAQTGKEKFNLDRSRANAAVEFDVPGGGSIVVDCALDGLGIEGNPTSSFGVGYYFQPQAYFKLGYSQDHTEEKGQTAAEFSIRF